jgi:hypothetical protein
LKWRRRKRDKRWEKKKGKGSKDRRKKEKEPLISSGISGMFWMEPL